MSIKEIIDIAFGIFKTNPLRVISRKRLILGIVLLLGISLLLYQSLLAMQLVHSRAMRFYLFSQKKLSAYQEKITQDPQILLSKIDEMRDRLKNLEKKFIPEGERAQTINDLKDLIAKTENYLISLDIKPLVALGTYQRLPFALSVKGDYVDITLLLNKLENYPRLIDIKDIKIEPCIERSSEVVMSLGAELFVIKE